MKGDVLVLGPWKGKQATEHTTISVGKGVCGSAARSGKTEVVNDVSKDNRYLSCFRSTRSEIVVPIIKNSRVIGEIDIDSDVPAAFDKTDKKFLEKIADMLCRAYLRNRFFFSTQDLHHRQAGSEKVRSSLRNEFFHYLLRVVIQQQESI